MNGLILAPMHDSPESRSPQDATGEFQPAALRFQRINHIPRAPILFNNNVRNPDPRFRVLVAPYGHVIRLIQEATETGPPLDVLAYFGHGIEDSLWSASIGPGHIGRLAQMLLDKGTYGMRIIFYGCAAGVRGGFAERLSNIMGPNAVVFGHTTSGPSYSNPNWVRYPGGAFVIGPGELRPAWEWALDHTDLWATFPFKTDAEIRASLPHAALTGAAAAGAQSST